MSHSLPNPDPIAQQWAEATRNGAGPGDASTAEAAGWTPPRPISKSSLPREPFPIHDAFPPALGSLREFVEAVGEAVQVPVDLPAMALLPVAGAAISKKFEIELRPGWREVPAIWSLILLPSGERKSATLGVMLDPIVRWEEDEAERLAPVIARAVEERQIIEARLASLRRDAVKGDESAAAAKKEAMELAEQLAATPILAPPALVTSDTTTEGLAGLMVANGERAIVASPEIDALEGMMGRYSDRGTPNMGLWLKGHTGDPERIVRRGRAAEHLQRPVLSVLMIVQPEAVADLLASRAARGRGLLGRFLFSMPGSMLGRRKTGGTARPLRPELQDLYGRALRHLLEIPIDVEAGPTIVGLDPEARALFNNFEAKVERELGPAGSLSQRSDWGGKLCGAVARIALILHCLKEALAACGEGSARCAGCAHEIDAITMAAALAWAPYVIEHERAAAGYVGSDPAAAVAKRLLVWLEQEGRERFTRRDAYLAARSERVQRAGDIDEPLELLEEHGYVRSDDAQADGHRGRPASPGYIVNPLWARGGGR